MSESELVAKQKQVTLLDTLDRILTKGILVRVDITMSVAEVDLIYLGLQVLLTSVERVSQWRKFSAQRGRETAESIPVAQTTAKVGHEL